MLSKFWDSIKIKKNIYKSENTDLFYECKKNKANLNKINNNKQSTITKNEFFGKRTVITKDNELFLITENAAFGRRYIFECKRSLFSTPYLLFNITCDKSYSVSEIKNIKPSDFLKYVSYDIGGSRINIVHDNNINILIEIYDCKFTIEYVEPNQYAIKIELPFDQFINNNVFNNKMASLNVLRFEIELQSNKINNVNIDKLYFGHTEIINYESISSNNFKQDICKRLNDRNTQVIRQKISESMEYKATIKNFKDMILQENDKFDYFQTFNSYSFHNEPIQNGHNTIRLNFEGIYEEFYIYFTLKNTNANINKIYDNEIIDAICVNCDDKTYFSRKNNEAENVDDEIEMLLINTINPIHDDHNHLKNIYKINFSNLKDKYIDCNEEYVKKLSVDFISCNFDELEINIIGFKKNIGIYYKNAFYNII